MKFPSTQPDTDSLSQPAGVAQPVPERDIDNAAGRTPGGNNLNAIPEKDADEVVPVSPEETELRDPALTPDDDKEKSVDQSGNRKRPL